MAYEEVRPPRKLKIFAIDPSLATRLETVSVNQAVIEIPWDKLSSLPDQDGPKPWSYWEYLEVIDYDPSCDCYYEPVDLNHKYLLAQNGHNTVRWQSKFHQQMVYAVAMFTIKNFETALGRTAIWAPRREKVDGKWKEDEGIRRLRIYPHALREDNAYYSPSKKALLFGYFPASQKALGRQLPGGTIFTCLSHDIIAHETTHALLMGCIGDLQSQVIQIC